jgi:hypothetical protein
MTTFRSRFEKVKPMTALFGLKKCLGDSIILLLCEQISRELSSFVRYIVIK